MRQLINTAVPETSQDDRPEVSREKRHRIAFTQPELPDYEQTTARRQTGRRFR